MWAGRLLVGVLCLLVSGARLVAAQTLAFPTAEGFGRFAQGGRGGSVYHVTNLQESGAGSLRNGLFQAGARTIVFDISGYISCPNANPSNGQFWYITQPYLTIAGQTAPSPGITIRCPIAIFTHDVIMRHVRVRVGAGTGAGSNHPALTDAGDLIGLTASTSNAYNVMLDHVSVSWASDDSASLYDGTRTATWQWSIVAEGIRNGGANDDGQSKSWLSGYDAQGTVHHTLFAKSPDRTPFIHGGDIDFVNNVFYGWGLGNLLPISSPVQINFVGNYYKSGPASPSGNYPVQFAGVGAHPEVTSAGLVNASLLYQANNFDTVLGANMLHNLGGSPAFPTTGSRINFPPVTTTTAAQAYTDVRAKAGAGGIGTGPGRDAVDTRILQEVANGTGAVLQNSENEVGGYPSLAVNTRPAGYDTDGDGIPDTWETSHGLNPASAADGAMLTASGYSNLEVYLNEVAGDTPPPSSGVFYVATTGDDARTCDEAKNITTPRRTLAGGVACLAVGPSTLYLRTGTYVERLDTQSQPIVGGTSWAAPTTIAAYGGETVTRQLPTPETGNITLWFRNPAQDRYIVLDHLIIEADVSAESASNALVFYPGTDHIRCQFCTVRKSYYHPIYIWDSPGSEILDSTVTTWTTTDGIGVVGNGTNVRLKGNAVSSGVGVGLSVVTGTTAATGVRLEANRVTGLSAGIVVSGSAQSGTLVANNVLYSNTTGLQVTGGVAGTQVLNNTIVSNTGTGVQLDSGTSTTTLGNTIMASNGTNLVNAGTSTTQQTNLTTAPAFVNAGAGDYHLTSSSTTALNTGTTYGAVAVDADGIARPQGSAYDIGAYEFVGTTPPAPGEVRVVNPWQAGGFFLWR